ncbi:MAG: DUF5125 domain-containing protein [Bacteroides sp.]|nr:DUF5125 domain-containing protein [Bacteroides sp.]
MKLYKKLLFGLAGIFALYACNDDDLAKGNPQMNPRTEFGSAMYGDSLSFTVSVSDSDVPLSTLKAQLYFTEDLVSETVIRTQTDGEYSGKIFIPYYPDIADGTAVLKLVLQNINFTVTEKEYDLNVSRPDFSYLTLVTEEGEEYRMDRIEKYQYAVTDKFELKQKAYIRTSPTSEHGNELVFGLENGKIVEGITDYITFSGVTSTYTISFNTLSYEASPFAKYMLNGVEMERVDDDNYQMDLSLSPGDELEFEGFVGFDSWWLDVDFFEKVNETTLKFLPLKGDYRITANLKHEYILVDRMNGDNFATLQADGSGAIWIIGEGIGKPSASTNAVGWTTEKGLCMAEVSEGIYQTTVVGGQSIHATSINFKFFDQKGWGDEFGHTRLTTPNTNIVIGNKTDDEKGNDIDSGNIVLAEDESFDLGGIYVIQVDVTNGINSAVLTVTKTGEVELPALEAYFDGDKMEAVDADNYKIEKEFTQGQVISVEGNTDFDSWWIDPDFFTKGSDGKLTFLPLDGTYRVTANTVWNYFRVEAMDGDELATLQSDGTGAIWIIGDEEIGKPSMDNAIDWGPERGLCMAQHSPKKYQITLVPGENIMAHSINFKFYYQKGWGNNQEFTGSDLTTDSDIVFIGLGDHINGRGDGNLGIIEEKTLTSYKPYVFTLDVSNGIHNAVLTVTEK